MDRLDVARRIGTVLALLCGASTPVLAQSTPAGDGRKLAQTFCSACHQVEPDTTMPSPNADAPTFAAIAATPGMTDLAIRVFLRSPHPTMPNFLLSEPEIDGVVAYIGRFRAK
jgi:mono/diheme cytochrome c family protein